MSILQKIVTVGVLIWWAFNAPNKIQPQEYSKGGGTDGLEHKYVANVNVYDSGKLNVNVNHFENANIWNAKYGNRVVSPLL